MAVGMQRTRPARQASGAGALLIALTMAAGAHALAQREAVPLNDYMRLGQRFTVTRPLASLWVTAPSWSDNEGGLALTLWDTPDRRRQLGRLVFTAIRDNQAIEIVLSKPLPAGAYYWEATDRTGATRVGLYMDTLAQESDDCAYFDGVPNRRRAFVYGTGSPEFVRSDVRELMATLRSDASREEKSDACRQLAVTGGRGAVQALASLLDDEDLAHMARHALEPMPYAEVDAALRKALGTLSGSRLIGVINTIGVRRDPRAVPLLTSRLGDTDAGVAAAAATAIGRIGTVQAARVIGDLLRGRKATGSNAPAQYEAALECGRVLLQAGNSAQASTLFDLVRSSDAAEHLRAAALRGAMEARGTRDPSLVLEQLRTGDLPRLRMALWTIARGLPGTDMTRLVADELPRLDEDRQELLIAALAHRRDGAALPALKAAAGLTGPVRSTRVRLAGVRALPVFGGEAIAALVALVQDRDAEVASAARDALASLSPTEVVEAATSLLSHEDLSSRLAGIELAAQRSLKRLAPSVLKATRHADPQMRLAAFRALRNLAGADEVAGLLDGLIAAKTAEETEAAEEALTAAAGRMPEPSAAAEPMIGALPKARPAQTAALLRALGAVGGADALRAVEGQLAASDETVRAAALDVICAWATPDAVPILLKLARQAPDTPQAIRCARGALRIAANPELTADLRLSLARDAAGLLTRDEERRILLSVLGGIPGLDALEMVSPHLDRASTRAEACEAVIAIVEKLGPKQSDPRAIAALEKVAGYADLGNTAARARELLAEIKGR